MAISVDWGTSVITVPKADTSLVDSGPPELREMDVDTFRLALKNLEDDTEGMPFSDTHYHTPETVLGATTYARFVEILDPYTVTFENGSYIVNLVGANNNIIEKTNLNSVSVRGNNSAGLVGVDSVGLAVDAVDSLALADDAIADIADGLLSRKATGGSTGSTANSVAAMLQTGGSWKVTSSDGLSVTFKDVDGSTLFTRTFTRAELDALKSSGA